MFAMMAGSVTFALSSHSRENVPVSSMLKGALLAVSCNLSVATLKIHKVGIFWAVCLLKFFIAIYFSYIELCYNLHPRGLDCKVVRRGVLDKLSDGKEKTAVTWRGKATR